MNVKAACTYILTQLEELVDNIEQDDFIKPSVALSGSTIGQHMRHTLEFYLSFETGVKSGLINYDKRNHDRVIENDKFIAVSIIRKIKNFVTDIDEARALSLEVSYDKSDDAAIVIQTNAMRELVYNIEHAVHHMAIMKIGVREVAPYITLPKDFGIAASTLRHRQIDTVVQNF